MEAFDKGGAAFLVLLDMSAALDIVNHHRLLDTMSSTSHVTGKALAWFTSYRTERMCKVRVWKGKQLA